MTVKISYYQLAKKYNENIVWQSQKGDLDPLFVDTLHYIVRYMTDGIIQSKQGHRDLFKINWTSHGHWQEVPIRVAQFT